MPNWVINKLTLEGENVSEIIKKHCAILEDGEKVFDFNTIIKRPKELEIEKSSKSLDGLKLHIAKINPLITNFGEMKDKIINSNDFALKITSMFNRFGNDVVKFVLTEKEVEELKKHYGKDLSETMNLGEQVFKNLEQFGHMDWYSWSIDNWGTKWNACNSFFPAGVSNVIYFETAWSPAVPVVVKLAEMYPNLKITHEYAEEQIGFYSGKHEYENGQPVSINDYESYSKEAYEQSFELWGGEDMYVFDDKSNTYVYRENEEEIEMD